MENRLNEIIQDYKKKNYQDNCIVFCNMQNNLVDTIKYAAIARDQNDKKHSHQKRINNDTLNKFAHNLQLKSNEIENVRDFDSLIKIIESNKVNGISSLAIYDTAHRIGIKLNIIPDKVYIHAGTLKGAKKLLGKKINSKFIDKSEFPTIFQKQNVTCDEIEDILCIYKDEFDLEKPFSGKFCCNKNNKC